MGACHIEREQGRRMLDGSICSASETCVCVNQGDIKFDRYRGAPIRLSGASDSSEGERDIPSAR